MREFHAWWIVVAVMMVFAVGLLVGGMTVAIDRGEARDERLAKLAAAERTQSCHADNVTRHQLRTLVHNGRDNLRQYRKRGLISEFEYKETLADQDKALTALSNRPCQEVLEDFLDRVANILG